MIVLSVRRRTTNFNPRSPHGERHQDEPIQASRSHFNPRSPHGERLTFFAFLYRLFRISIHAPRMGSDEIVMTESELRELFQSTLPAWGATCISNIKLKLRTYFNPRSPHGERHTFFCLWRVWRQISIHAPRMGSDSTALESNITNGIFQSTLPAWGATKGKTRKTAPKRNFNPRSPHGERPIPTSSRPSAVISIHAPRMGSDSTVKAYSNDRIKRSTLREPHFSILRMRVFRPLSPCVLLLRAQKNQRIRVSFGSYPGLAPTCFTLDWYRFPRL